MDDGQKSHTIGSADSQAELKIANILEMGSPRAKWSEIWESGVVATSGTLAHGQVSCPNMNMCSFQELWLMANFHGQIGQFCNDCL